MKKFHAVYKRNGKEKAVVVEVHENDLFVVIDDKGTKEVKKDTIKRWYTMGAEIVEKQVVEIKAAERCVKKDGSVRKDKFRPKLNEADVLAIRAKFAAGSKKSHLAKEYEVSFRTITCIIERLMWKHVG